MIINGGYASDYTDNEDNHDNQQVTENDLVLRNSRILGGTLTDPLSALMVIMHRLCIGSGAAPLKIFVISFSMKIPSTISLFMPDSGAVIGGCHENGHDAGRPHAYTG